MPRPAPRRHSASAAAFASFSTPTGSAEALAAPTDEVDVVDRQVDRTEGLARAPIEIRGDAVAHRATPSSRSLLDDLVERGEQLLLRARRARDLDRPPDLAVAGDVSGEDLRPADIHADRTFRPHRAATIPPSHGRRREALPRLQGRGGERPCPAPTAFREVRRDRCKRSAPHARTTERRRWGRWIVLALLGLIVLAVVWGALAIHRLRAGIQDANDRVPASVVPQLTKQDGLLLSQPTTILVLGTDGGTQKGGRALAAPTRSSCSAPTRAGASSRTSRSRGTSRSRSPGTARRRSTPRSSGAARRSR